MHINIEFHFFYVDLIFILVRLNHKNMEEEKFKNPQLRMDGIGTLLQPGLHPNSASRLLHRWVVRKRKLVKTLKKLSASANGNGN